MDDSKSKAWLDQYEEEGYAVLEGFLTDQECDQLKDACQRIVDDLDVEKEHKSIFTTYENRHKNDDYFITSGDKIRYFFEADAFNESGELAVPKEYSLNKIGHALHWLNPEFRKVSFSEKVKRVARTLGLVDPKLIQGMYIFKNPRIGGEVRPHQDASFLYMEPLKLCGLWFALEDATLENGCLWFIPGSHKSGEIDSGRRMVRVKDTNGNTTSMAMLGVQPQPDDSLFVPVPAKKGSLVMIHGLVMHKSEANTSDKSRHAFTLHLIDQHESTWSDLNWLQPTDDLPFPALYSAA